jgi:hypothetical protein
LKANKAKESDERKREKIQKEIEVWEKHGDRSKKEGRDWNIEAVKVIGNLGNTWNFSEQDKEEMAQHIASNFYSRPNLRNSLDFSRPDRKGGPTGLLKLFKIIIGKEALNYRNREWSKRQQDIPLETEEGRGIGRTLKDVGESDFERMDEEEFKREMDKAMLRKLPKKDDKLLYKMWRKVSDKKGPGGVNFSKDIYPEWGELTGKTSSAMDMKWKKMKKMVMDFYIKAEGRQPSKRVLKRLKISEVVADDFMRRRFATWMLEIARWRGVV